jgi:hypothetical protein
VRQRCDSLRRVLRGVWIRHGKLPLVLLLPLEDTDCLGRVAPFCQLCPFCSFCSFCSFCVETTEFFWARRMLVVRNACIPLPATYTRAVRRKNRNARLGPTPIKGHHVVSAFPPCWADASVHSRLGGANASGLAAHTASMYMARVPLQPSSLLLLCRAVEGRFPLKNVASGSTGPASSPRIDPMFSARV